LDCVIRQMDIGVIAVVHIILCTGCTKITLFEKVARHVLGDQDPNTDVKFTVV
jgi:hypothetical protein